MSSLLQEAYVSFGSNLGNSEAILVLARTMIAALPSVVNMWSSHLYKTSPVSTIKQPEYFNAVVKCSVQGTYREFFEELCKIEKQFGRDKKNVEAPRLLDLDLLLFGNVYVEEKDLAIPHPRMLQRAFVIIPLREVAPDGIIPFPTREVVDMLQLDTIEIDPKQKVTLFPSVIWDRG